jgi:hypothetical protein
MGTTSLHGELFVGCWAMKPGALKLSWLALLALCVFSAPRIEQAVAAKPVAKKQHAQTPASADLRSTTMATQAASSANAGVILEWNANNEPDIAGYKLFYGTASHTYTAQRDVGKVTHAVVPELTLGAAYFFALTAYNTAALESKLSTEVQGTAVRVSPTPTATPTATAVPTPTPSPTEILHTGWTVTFVDSEELAGEGGQPRANAIDGNPSTMWHTQWQTANPPPPHEIQINLGATRNVAGFGYLPRQDGLTVGMISKYEFYVSTDGVSWGAAVASGTFPSGAAEKKILFRPKLGRFVRLRALTEVNGKQWTSVAEVNVLGLPTPPPAATPTPSPSSAYALAITPATASVASTGGTASYILTVTPTGGFDSAITFNVDGLPAGAAVSYSANPATTKSTLNITLAACVPGGTYTFTVKGFGCGTPPLTRALTATVVKQ